MGDEGRFVLHLSIGQSHSLSDCGRDAGYGHGGRWP